MMMMMMMMIQLCCHDGRGSGTAKYQNYGRQLCSRGRGTDSPIVYYYAV